MRRTWASAALDQMFETGFLDRLIRNSGCSRPVQLMFNHPLSCWPALRWTRTRNLKDCPASRTYCCREIMADSPLPEPLLWRGFWHDIEKGVVTIEKGVTIASRILDRFQIHADWKERSPLSHSTPISFCRNRHAPELND